MASPRNIEFSTQTIVAMQDGYAMVYRVVDNSRETRRLASCLLTKHFDVVPGSVTPLSDLISFVVGYQLGERELTWHADPRFATLGGRIYLTWNDACSRPVNHQFILRIPKRSGSWQSGLRPTHGATGSCLTTKTIF